MNFLGIIKIGINFQVGWESLVRNKFRSILTLLGIVLGIFIVVVSVSLSQSIKDFMISEFKTFSGNTLIFMWHEPWIEKDDGRWVRNPIKDNFWLEDVSEMAESLDISITQVVRAAITQYCIQSGSTVNANGSDSGSDGEDSTHFLQQQLESKDTQISELHRLLALQSEHNVLLTTKESLFGRIRGFFTGSKVIGSGV